MKTTLYSGLMALCAFCLLATDNVAAESLWDQPVVHYDGDKLITVYRSPDCHCCYKWIKHLEQHDFTVTDVLTERVDTIKQRHRLPRQLASCHTAIIDGYVIEGHVPADDIKRLLIERPAVAGLSVPQMPVGTPGMEMGQRRDPFAVLQFDADGQIDIYRKYEQY